ncbi:MAG TPA: filamentous hemagglutinin, partial [Cyanothece sp. UBA12306]|nr:filamentous hemagglutinin [Cyanothece sp. UBA12306]
LESLDNLQVNNSNITTSTQTGVAGSISLNNQQQAVNSVEISENSNVAAQANQSGGEAGSVSINSRNLTVNQGSAISASNISGTRGGDVNLENIERLVVNGSEISATTVDGTAGNLQINQNQSPVDNLELNNGNITVEASGTGNSGNLTVNAKTVNLQNQAQISASTNSGMGGDINLESLDNLQVNNSNISASTETGRAGNLTIKATESVKLNDTGSLSVEAIADGTAGNLTLETGQINIIDGGRVSVSSPQGQAGNITIYANTLSLNEGFITAETGKSQGEEGANISLKVFDLLRIENESLISATANGVADGGNIEIETPFLVVFPPTGPDGSDIIAKAEQGSGGRIAINAQGIFGIRERKATPGNRSNDLDASSESGSSGQIILNRELDPNRGLVEFPQTVVDPDSLIAQNACTRGSNSEFVITGRGGLPPSINEDLTSETTQIDLVEPVPMMVSESNNIEIGQPKNLESSSSEQKSIVPAQGWVFNEKGEIVLVAYDPTMTTAPRLPKMSDECP